MKNLIDAAMGRIEPDLVLKNCRIVNVFSGEIERGDIAVKDGYICGVGEYGGATETDLGGQYVLPGLIDAHMHIESSMVTPQEYAKAAVPKGVTTVMADPHEITNVCGEAGLKFMQKCAEGLPLDINFMLPSCVPAAPTEHSGAVLTASDTARLAPDFYGIGEMMNYPGIVNADGETLGKLVKPIRDGHAPLLAGRGLDAYLCAGIKTDHECGNIEEMKEKLGKGMYILMRDGTLSRDVARLVGGLTGRNMRRCMFCTDDLFVGAVSERGSISACVRKAISLGIEPIDAITMATLNAAECYRMYNKGAVAPSYIADLVVSEDLELTKITRVYKNGVLAAENGKALFETKPVKDEAVLNTVHLPKIDESFFAFTPKTKEFTTIELIPESIITKKTTANMSDNLSKICVIERHHNLGTKGFGFVTNYGIKNGAIATSVGHDSHNIAVIGDNDRDMAAAVNALGKTGGIAVVQNGAVTEFLPLEIAGLMSLKPAEEVAKIHARLDGAAKKVGVTDGVDPFLSLSFLPLPVIPEIRVTDSGLFDVTKFEVVKI